MTAPAIVGEPISSGRSGNGTVAPALPAGAQSYLAIIARTEGDLTPPSGWTLVGTYGGGEAALYQAGAGAGDTWTIAGMTANDVMTISIIGFASDISITSAQVAAGSATSPTVTVAEESLALRAFAGATSGGSNPVAYPDGETLGRTTATTYSAAYGIGIFTAFAASTRPAGATGTAVWTVPSLADSDAMTFILEAVGVVDPPAEAPTGLTAVGVDHALEISFTPSEGATESRILWRRTDLVEPAVTTQSSAPSHLDRIDDATGTDGTYQYTWGGAGVRAYIIDSGVNWTEPELSGRLATPGFSIGETDPYTDADPDGHGTWTARIVGGTTNGVAKGVTIVSVNVSDDPASGSNDVGAETLESIVDFILADRGDSPAVVNGSLGFQGLQEGGTDSPAVVAQFTRLLDAGIPVVLAAGAGNVDIDSRLTEADPRMIWVSSSTVTDERVGDMPYGQSITVYAPWVTTSGAAPQVTGLVAKIQQPNPELGPTRIKEVIASQAMPVLTGVPDGPNLQLSANAQTTGWSISPASASFSLSELDQEATYEVKAQSLVGGVWSEESDPVSATTTAAVAERIFTKGGAPLHAFLKTASGLVPLSLA